MANPRPKLKYKELKAQLVSQMDAIDKVVKLIDDEDPNAWVTQDQLEIYEDTMDKFEQGKTEATRRARVSC